MSQYRQLSTLRMNFCQLLCLCCVFVRLFQTNQSPRQSRKPSNGLLNSLLPSLLFFPTKHPSNEQNTADRPNRLQVLMRTSLIQRTVSVKWSHAFFSPFEVFGVFHRGISTLAGLFLCLESCVISNSHLTLVVVNGCSVARVAVMWESVQPLLKLMLCWG